MLSLCPWDISLSYWAFHSVLTRCISLIEGSLHRRDLSLSWWPRLHVQAWNMYFWTVLSSLNSALVGIVIARILSGNHPVCIQWMKLEGDHTGKGCLLINYFLSFVAEITWWCLYNEEELSAISDAEIRRLARTTLQIVSSPDLYQWIKLFFHVLSHMEIVV